MFRKLILMSALVLIATTSASAHDGWIEKRDGELTFVYGHDQKIDPYKPEYIREAKAFDAKGQAIPIEIVRHKDYATVAPQGNPAIVTMLYYSGYWVKTPDGYKNIGKREADSAKLQVILAEKSRKDAKTILVPCESYSKPVGLLLEIIPEKDPFTAKAGEAFPIKVLLEGQPVEGLDISLGAADHSQSKNLPKTDKDGKASVDIAKPGFQVITTRLKKPISGDPDADTLVACSSLTFAVK
jgi:nickel transport protein